MSTLEANGIRDIIFSNRVSLDEVHLKILMEQYKLFVDTSERLVARRQLVNTFFLSVNTLTLSAIGLIATEVNETPWITSGAIAISIAAIMLCVAWKTLVRSYA